MLGSRVLTASVAMVTGGILATKEISFTPVWKKREGNINKQKKYRGRERNMQ